MLLYRVFTALFLFLIVLGMLFYSNDISWFLFIGLIVLMGSLEYLDIFKLGIIDKLIYIFIIMMIGLIIYNNEYIIYGYRDFLYCISFIFWVILVPLLLYFKFKLSSRVLIYCLGLILFLPFWHFMYKFRRVFIFNIDFNGIKLLMIMGMVWVADIGAYFCGRLFGVHKLAPSISPGKTIEGYVGGLILVYIYFYVLSNIRLFRDNFIGIGLIDSIILIFFLVGISLLGDLFESYLKRSGNIKDSGKILPGHGGVFDRIDSMLAVFGVLPFTFFIIDIIK